MKSVRKAVNDGKPKLLDQLREVLRSRYYSRRTEHTYCLWIKRHISFHHLRHPKETAETEVNAFLTHLAVFTRILNRGGKGVRSPVDAL